MTGVSRHDPVVEDKVDDKAASEAGLWFRDRLQEVMGLGGAGFVVLASWVLSQDSVVSIGHATSENHREAAGLLLVFVPMLWVVWYAAIVRLRGRCPEHATVMHRRWVHAIAWGVGIGVGVVLHAVTLD